MKNLQESALSDKINKQIESPQYFVITNKMGVKESP